MPVYGEKNSYVSLHGYDESWSYGVEIHDMSLYVYHTHNQARERALLEISCLSLRTYIPFKTGVLCSGGQSLPLVVYYEWESNRRC